MCRLLFLLLVSCVTFIDGRYFRNDYTYQATANGWLKLHLVPATWEAARIRCFFEGSVLASPLNEEMLSAMKIMLGQRKHPIFTGISATISSGYFSSIEGIPLEDILKDDKIFGHEDCIAMYGNGTLADVTCHKPLPYMCYKKNSQNIPAANQCGTVDPEYIFDSRTNHCYKLHTHGQDWSRAFMACSVEGGYLAIINSDEEAKVLNELMAKYPAAKISAKHKDIIAVGFHDWSQHGVFMTVQGETLKEAGYEKWAANQPDNATTGEYCGSVFRDALLNDVWCHDTIPFICEKPPGSLLDNKTGSQDEVYLH